LSWRLGVAGLPIEHSLSPRLHEAGLRLCGLAGTSERVPLSGRDAGRLVALMSRFDALSVTMPLKALAVAYCDELDEVAVRTGAVNSLLRREGRLLGANTDGRGLLDALAAQLGFSAAGARVLVLGAGGAARGIVDALVGAGAAEVALDSASPERARALAGRYGVVSLQPSGRVDLVVNATPAHVRGAAEAGVAHGAPIGVDIAYEPRMTPWRAALEARGCRTVNGLGMLAYQAARQMRWWFGVEVDGAALLEEIE
jgi:shikimate dehydrogenase